MIADVSNNVRKLWSWNITYYSMQSTKWYKNSMIFLSQTSVLTTRVWMVIVLRLRQRLGNADVIMAGKDKTVILVCLLAKKHVVIETEIFIKTQILHLKIRLIRSRKQSYFTNRCFFSKEDIVYKCNFELIDDPDCFLVEDTNDDFDFTRYYVCPVFLYIFFWTFYTFSYFEPELSEINYVLVNLRPVLKSQHIKNKYRD